MVSIISKGADNLNSFRSIVPSKSDKSHSVIMSASYIKSENIDTNLVNVLSNKSFKSSIPSSDVLSLVKSHSNGKSTINANQLNLNNINNICYNDLKNVINMNNMQLPQRNDTLNHQNKLVNNQKKRYSCDQCSYSTDRRDLYRRHENIHRDEKPFRCYVCNKMFNRADHVKKHFLRIHKGLEYNVKLIKRINGVDYTSTNAVSNGSPNTNTNLTSESTISNNNNLICDKNNNIHNLNPNNSNSNNNNNNKQHNNHCNVSLESQGIKSLPQFNMALWNEQSSRLLLENYNSQSKFMSTPRLTHFAHQLANQDREPLSDSNVQSNEQRDFINIMNDGLTLCLKLNGSNIGLNGRTPNPDEITSHFPVKLSSHVNSPRSTPPTPSPSPPSSDSRGLNVIKGSTSRNQENRRSLYDNRSDHRKSTSLLSPVNCKSLSPPQTTATSLVKPKCLDSRNNCSPNNSVIQTNQPMTITSLKDAKSKAVNTNNNIINGSNIIEKVDEMIKMSENEFNRRLFESMSSTSSSTLLADRDSYPHSTLIFNTETSNNNSKKTNWFNRLNPVRVNTISTNNDESNERSNSQSPTDNEPKISHKLSNNNSEDEISSETWESDEVSLDELNIIEDIDSEDDDHFEISEFKDKDVDIDVDADDIYLQEIKSNTFDCEFCGCSFANYKSLHTHRYLLHRYINKQKNVYPYSCVICGKRSSTQKQMINHMSSHNGMRNSTKYSINSNRLSSSASFVSIKSSIRINRRKQSEPRRVAISPSNSNC